MQETVFKNAMIVLPDQVVSGSLLIRDGRIAEISPGATRASDAIDCAGDYLAPGLIELHTDNIERHVAPRPGALWPCDAAILAHDREMVSAGITTCFDAVCIGEVHPKSIRLDIVDEICGALNALAQSNVLKADHRLHLRCEVSYGGLLDLLELHLGWPILGLISVMDHTPGARQYVDVAHYAEYYQGKFGLSDAELESFIDERRSDGERYSAANRQAVIERAHSRGLPLASHDDATVAHVAEAKRDGVAIAEFPTTLEAARAARDERIAILMGAQTSCAGARILAISPPATCTEPACSTSSQAITCPRLPCTPPCCSRAATDRIFPPPSPA